MKFPGYVLDVAVTVVARKGITRRIQEVDGFTQSPSHRRTRTENLEHAHQVTLDRNEQNGSNAEKLVTRWQWRDRHCGHKGSCWIDDTGDHHRLNTLKLEKWATAITSNYATELTPPMSLLKGFLEEADGEGKSSGKKKKKSAIEQMQETLERQMEMESMRSMKAMISDTRQQAVQSTAPAPQQWAAPPPYGYPPQYYQHQYHLQAYEQSLLRPRSPIPPTPGSPTPGPRSQSELPPNRSSPIGGSDDDADDILDAFWQWKKSRTERQDRKLQYCSIQSRINQEGWDIDDIKSMANTSTHIYKRAIEAGLPDGLIRKLGGELRQFKKLWRENYGPAFRLAALGGHGDSGKK